MAVMNTYFEGAELAVAAYSLALSKEMNRDAYVATLRSIGMGGLEAQRFASTYEIVDHLPNTISGFSATVFKRGDQYFLAIRGTEGLSSFFSSANDWLTNFTEVAAKGIAIRQTLDLFNYLQDLTARAGDTVYHYSFNNSLRVVIAESSTALSTGALHGKVFAVTGHSLGGHLALVASRLMPSLTDAVYTYNAPGFDSRLFTPFPDPGVEEFLSMLRNAELSARGTSTVSLGPWNTTDLNNLAVPEDVVHSIGNVPGRQLLQFSELGARGRAFDSHTKNAMADALAVYRLLALIDPAKADTEILGLGASIFRAASNVPTASLGTVVNALGQLFAAGTTVQAGNRDQLYQRLFSLDSKLNDTNTGTLKSQYEGLGLSSLAAWSALQMVDAASMPSASNADLALRYALKELTPFAVTGPTDFYAPYNANGRLNLYDQQTGQGFTKEYLLDRAQFLVRKIERNNADITGVLRDSKVLGALNFQDKNSGDAIRIIGPAGGERFVIFGKDGVNETIAGQSDKDHLYGANGKDILRGGDGADYLEGGDNVDELYGEGGDGDHLVGGAGDDTLDGGPGNDFLDGGKGGDTYVYRAGQGVDTITDSDGRGFIRFWTGPSTWSDLRGGRKTGLNLWESEDAQFRYTLFQEEAGTTLVITRGTDHLFVTNFKSGDLGITLEGTAQASPPPSDIFAQTAGNDFYVRQAAATGAHILGLAGDDFLIVEPVASGSQEGSLVEGGTGSDALSGGSGADRLFSEGQEDLQGFLDGTASTVPGIGREVVLGNKGNDLIVGGRGNDWLGGGTGKDIIYGGAGDDVISGSGEAFFQDVNASLPQQALVFNVHDTALSGSVLTSALTAAAAGDRIIREGLDDQGSQDDGDIVVAGAGDDEVWGGYGDDELLGEAGRDTIRGEAGNDTLFGGDHADVLYGDGEQVPVSLQGNDYLDGGAGEDVLYGGGGTDYLYGGKDRDVLQGDAGMDYLYGEEGNDDLLGGAGEDTLNGGPGTDLLKGGPNDDTYVMEAGGGQDTVVDSEGINRFVFGEGISAASLTMSRSSATNNLAIQYGPPDDVLVIEAGYLGKTQTFTFADGSTYDLQQILNVGTTTPITLAGTGSGATLLGGSGNDLLTAGKNDTLDGGRGNDSLVTTGNFATFRFTRGDGNDVVTGSARGTSFRFDETIEWSTASLSRVGPGDPRAVSPRDLVLQYGDTGDSIFIPDSPNIISNIYLFGPSGFFDHIDFLEHSGLALDWVGSADDETVSGTKFDDHLAGSGGEDELAGLGGNDLLEGGDQGDTLSGDAGDDVLVGGTGSDRLVGGSGNDRYVFSSGHGVDIVEDNVGSETIEIGANLASVGAELVNGTDGNIYLAVDYGAGDTILVRQNFDTGVAGSTIDFQFASGERLGRGELSSLKFAAPLNFQGSTQALRVTGSRFADTLIGGTQDDRLEGGEGNDQIAGDAGRDFIGGGAGDDLLVGNAGDDTLDGGGGADTYRFHRGMGQDLILEQSGDLNTLRFTNSGLSATEDLSAQRSGADLILLVKNTREGVVIRDYFVPESPDAAQSWQVETAAGLFVPLQTLIGILHAPPHLTNIGDVIDDFTTRARAFQESALIAAGYVRQNDGTFVRSERWESDFFSSHTARTVTFADPGQVSDSGSIARQSAQVVQTGDTVTRSEGPRVIRELVSYAKEVSFDLGGNVPSGSAGTTRAFQLTGTQYTGLDYGADNEAVAGPNWMTNPLTGQLEGRTNRVYVSPSWANRTITHVHDELTFNYDINIAHITGGSSGNFISTSPFSIVDAGAGDDTVTANNGLLYVPGEFSGGFSLPEPLPNSPGSLLYGNAGNDLLIGEAGDDVLIGGSGSDTMRGGAGNDTYVLFTGDGSDEISEDGVTRAGVARANVLSLPQGVGLGALTFSWSEELKSAPFVEAGGTRDFPLYRGSVQSLHTILTVGYGGGDQVRIDIPHAEQDAETGIDFVELGDGTRIGFNALVGSAGPVPTFNPHHRDNSLSGPGPLYGGPGDDTIESNFAIGGAGADRLVGTDGGDVLFGALLFTNTLGSGVRTMGTLWDEGNTYRGGPGSDAIWTTAGSDAIEFDPGDGADIVTDLYHDDLYYYYGGSIDDLFGASLDEAARDPVHQAALLGSQDTLRFGAGILPRDVFVYRQTSTFFFPQGPEFDDLVFAHRNGTDAVRFLNWYTSGDFGTLDPHQQLSRVEFADGTTWDRATIDGLAANAPSRQPFPFGGWSFGSPGDDQVLGGPDADFLSGGAGNDVLDGADGNDTYFFQPGDGSDRIQESGIGTFDALVFGFGITQDMLALGLGSLVIRVADTGDEVHIDGFDPENALNITGGIEEFVFADGSSLTYAELLEHGFDITGTPANDVLSGTSVADRFDGMGGDDSLRGGAGSDTYFFERGSGADLVEDSGGDFDAVVLGDGIAPQDVILTRSGTALTLSIGAVDRLTFRQEVGTDFLIEQVRFAGGIAWDTDTIESRVETGVINSAPTVTVPIPGRMAEEDTLFRFQVPAGTFSDPGDVLALAATRAGGSPLPAWLAFDTLNATFTGTPANADVGFVDVTVTATDRRGASISNVFRLTVAGVNDAPTIVSLLPDRSVAAGAMFRYTVPVDTYADIDAGDVLTFDASRADGSGLPAWLSFDPVARRFEGVPANVDAGLVSIKVLATDQGSQSVSDVFDLTVIGEPAVGQAAVASDAPGGMSNSTSGGSAENEAMVDSVDTGQANDVTSSELFQQPDVSTDAANALPNETVSAAPEDLMGDGVARSAADTSLQDDSTRGFGERDAGIRESADDRRDTVDSLDILLARTSHDPFELAARELERSSRSETGMSAVEIARRWNAVARYGDWLAANQDEDELRGAALDWQFGRTLFGPADFGATAGPGGVAGVGQGAANLLLLKGLAEGFQELRA